jgi:hypothetical protein
MLESIGEIATKHIVIGTIIGIYLLGVFALRLWCGLCTKPKENMDDMDSFVILIWPIMIPMFCVEIFVDFCSWASRKIPFRKTAWSFIVRVLDIATLPFRPFTLGQRVAQWRKNRSKQCNIKKGDEK